mgnify:CR=1 FL=1
MSFWVALASAFLGGSNVFLCEWRCLLVFVAYVPTISTCVSLSVGLLSPDPQHARGPRSVLCRTTALQECGGDSGWWRLAVCLWTRSILSMSHSHTTAQFWHRSRCLMPYYSTHKCFMFIFITPYVEIKNGNSAKTTKLWENNRIQRFHNSCLHFRGVCIIRKVIKIINI